jgi:alpha-glucosidase
MQRHVYDKSRPENLEFLRKMRRMMDRYPGTMTVAEVACDTGVQRLAEYVGSPDLLHTAYSFDLLGRAFSAAGVRRAVESFFAQPGGGWPSWAFSNHDVERAVSRWGGKDAPPAFAKVLIATLCALPGTPFIYQGEELGLPEAEVPYERRQDPYGIAFWPEIKGRDGCRTPMPWRAAEPHAGFSAAAARGKVEPWLPVPEAHRGRAVDVQDVDPGSVLAFTRAFLKWRRTLPVLREGRGEFLDAPEPAIAWLRRSDEDAVLCAFNLGEVEARIALPPGVRVTALEGHGLAGVSKGGSLVLPGHGGFFGAVA